ncbi:MAG: hypothetical protein XD95_0077 [Microgenomates bacterium 39_7]|nr:MAG: hypothetical protein XD95_0077 [Microgenomates bacterium 39_7]
MQNSIFTDSDLQKTLKKDKELLEKTQLPIITVSSTYIEDLKGFHDLPEEDTAKDVVFSRAHYSMALAVAVQAWQDHIDPKKAWVVDPTNYVQAQEWSKIIFTETIGKTLARAPLLKKLKDLADRFARNKLPILASITPPLNYLTKNISQPILSLHIASGNILAAQGKQVVQMVTDPHVREDYLNEAERKNITFLVFDEKTKTDFIEKAVILNKKVDQDRVIVTGPPVDPRIVQFAQKKQIWQKGPLKMCITTGGLGTNKNEIKSLLDQLLPELRKKPSPYQVLVYAGTHFDIYKMVKQLAATHKVALNEIKSFDPANFKAGGKLSGLSNNHQTLHKTIKDNRLSIIYHPQIVDANELLTHLAFPWADGFISKPSGDMAYDAVASGSFLLTLKEWGEWEHNIRQIFVQ